MLSIDINFGGFYESEHSGLIESALFIDEDFNDDCVDYKKIHILYSQKIIDFINYQYEINVKFNNLDSPRFYNYSTDLIIAYISLSDSIKILHIVNKNYKKDLKELITYKTESHSGYIPLYKYEDLLKKENRDFLLSLCFDVLIDKDDFIDDWFSYYDRNCIYDDISNFEYVA